MATTEQINSFIGSIGPIIRKIAFSKGYKYPSAIIAQACLESAFGTSSLGYKYHNYFGMKCGSSWTGKSVNLDTKEEYSVGTVTDIKANFRVYDSMEDGVKGYFDFINKARYANLKSVTSSKNYLETIKSDGYATNSSYVNSVYKVVTRYGLISFDTPPVTLPNIAKPILKYGSTGTQAKYLQQDLNYLGYKGSNNKKLTVDGDLGTNTIYALKKFQFDYKLTVDGVYGSKSASAMKSAIK